MAEPQVKVYGHGYGDEFPDGPPTAVIHHQGLRLMFRFAPGDLAGEGDLQELRVLPGGASLKPHAVARFAPQVGLYINFARSAMRILGSPEGESKESFRANIDPVRKLRFSGGPLDDEFYKEIAETYEGLVAGGERHPVKAISQMYGVTIGASSRWISGARERNFLPPKEEK